MRVCRKCLCRMRELEANPFAEPRSRSNPSRWFTGLSGYPAPGTLLTAESAKTRLGKSLGFDTYIQYLLPATMLSKVMRSAAKPACMYHSKGCEAGCLVQTGHGSFDGTTLARARKTWLFQNDTEWYLNALRTAIKGGIRKTLKKAPIKDPVTGHVRPIIPVFRLNGTSDYPWEDMGLLDEFPDVQFYDYTKAPLHVRPRLLDPAVRGHYHVTFSYSDRPESWGWAHEYLAQGFNVAVVWRTFSAIADLLTRGGGRWGGPVTHYDPKKPYRVIDGDRDDLRFLDPPGVVVALFAKVSGDPRKMKAQRQDEHGFFVERVPDVAQAEGWRVPISPSGEVMWHAIDGDTWHAFKALWEHRLTGELKLGASYVSPITGQPMPKRGKDRQRAMRVITGQKEAFWLEHSDKIRSEELGPGAIKRIAQLASLTPGYRRYLTAKGRRVKKSFPAAEVQRQLALGSAAARADVIGYGKKRTKLSGEDLARLSRAAGIKNVVADLLRQAVARAGQPVAAEPIQSLAREMTGKTPNKKSVQAVGRSIGIEVTATPGRTRNPSLPTETVAREQRTFFALKAAMPKNPMELSYAEGALDVWQRAYDRLKRSKVPITVARSLLLSARAQRDAATGPEQAAFFEGAVDALEMLVQSLGRRP